MKESPFGEGMAGAMKRLDETLKGLGKPDRKEGDKYSEVNFRCLGAMLEVMTTRTGSG